MQISKQSKVYIELLLMSTSLASANLDKEMATESHNAKDTIGIFTKMAALVKQKCKLIN